MCTFLGQIIVANEPQEWPVKHLENLEKAPKSEGVGLGLYEKSNTY